MTETGDIAYDEIRNPEIFGIGRVFVGDDEYKIGAIAMLLMISKKMGWEESETLYYNKFFEKELGSHDNII